MAREAQKDLSPPKQRSRRSTKNDPAFLGGGALFKDQIHRFVGALEGIGAQLGSFIVLSILAWIAWKFIYRQRFPRALRIARIDVDSLRELIDSNDPPQIFDLRDRFSLESEGFRVAGAQVIGLDELENRHQEIPRDREIILYCT